MTNKFKATSSAAFISFKKLQTLSNWHQLKVFFLWEKIERINCWIEISRDLLTDVMWVTLEHWRKKKRKEREAEWNSCRKEIWNFLAKCAISLNGEWFTDRSDYRILSIACSTHPPCELTHVPHWRMLQSDDFTSSLIHRRGSVKNLFSCEILFLLSRFFEDVNLLSDWVASKTFQKHHSGDILGNLRSFCWWLSSRAIHWLLFFSVI